jgi:stage III sporulation protein AG
MDMTALREKTGKWFSKYKYLALILLVGIGLMLIPSKSDTAESTQQIAQQTVETTGIAEQLEAILSNIKGAGKVQVMLTVKSGEQTVYQTDTPATDRQDTVIITDDNRAQNGLVQQVISPTYRGAIVLCQGADSASVCLAIKEAVSKVTGLDTSQISVLKMK